MSLELDRSGRRPTSDRRRQSSARYAGAAPPSDRCTSPAILNTTRWRTGSQCSCRNTDVMWSQRRAPVTRRTDYVPFMYRPSGGSKAAQVDAVLTEGCSQALHQVIAAASVLQLSNIWMIKCLLIQTSYYHVPVYFWVKIGKITILKKTTISARALTLFVGSQMPNGGTQLPLPSPFRNYIFSPDTDVVLRVSE